MMWSLLLSYSRIYLGYTISMKLSALALRTWDTHKIHTKFFISHHHGLNVVRTHTGNSWNIIPETTRTPIAFHSMCIYTLVHPKRYLLSFYGFDACVPMMYNTFTHPCTHSRHQTHHHILLTTVIIFRWLLKGLFAAIDRNKGFDLGLMVVARA